MSRGVWPSSAVAGDSRNASNCQPSLVPRLLAMGCSAGQMAGSNCQRGWLEAQRRLDTPMQRPLFDPVIDRHAAGAGQFGGLNEGDHVDGLHAVAAVVRARA